MRGDGPVPDPLNRGWRDYGNRVGFWRLLEVFDDLGLPVTAIVNSDVTTAYPPIIEAGINRSWAWVAHGQTNSTDLSGMGEDEEREHPPRPWSRGAGGRRPLQEPVAVDHLSPARISSATSTAADLVSALVASHVL